MVRHFTNNPFIAGSSIVEERPPGFFDVPGRFIPLLGKTQIPQLNQDDWKDLLPITNFEWSAIPDESYVCLLATGEIPEKAQEVAKQYALYLKIEERYDFPTYHESKKDQHEIFYILKADYSVCIGVFIFEKMETSIFNGLRRNWEGYVEKREMRGKSLPQENLDQFLKLKIESSERKYNEAQDNPKRQRQHGTNNQSHARQKYEERCSLFMTLSFFHNAKPHFPEDMRKLLSLRVAWIHPFHRRQKLLTELWPIFQSRYGVFDIDCPSDSMKKFISKNTHDNISLRSGGENRHFVV